jgi:hypothetical protein
VAHIGRFVDMAATLVPSPPLGETAPPEITERDELPRPEAMPAGV